MEITDKMLEDLEKEYQQLKTEYEETQYREAIYRGAISLTKHTVSIVDIENHSIHKVHYEEGWTSAYPIMENAPESVIATGAIHPQDVDTLRQIFKDIYACVPSGSYNIRVATAKGRWDYLCIYWKVLYDENQKPTKAVCFSENVTQKREAEMLFEQLMNILEEKSEFSWRINLTKDIVISHNDKSAEAVEEKHVVSYTQLNESAVSRVAPEYRKQISDTFNRAALLQAFYDGKREIALKYQYTMPDTEDIMWMESIIYLMMNTDSDICAILSVQNISDEMEKESELNSMASYDQLCKVLNRKVFEEAVTSHLEKKEKATLFMIDVDDFKNVNDCYGHIFGDEVLIKIAETLRTTFASEDYVARYGGDEFCVAVIGDKEAEVVEALAIVLLDRIEDLVFENGSKASISIGIAQNEASLKDLFVKADKALYESKHKGKGSYTLL